MCWSVSTIASVVVEVAGCVAVLGGGVCTRGGVADGDADADDGGVGAGGGGGGAGGRGVSKLDTSTSLPEVSISFTY